MPKLTDSHKRRIDYLRLAVTDRCNLRCVYCMPSEGIKTKPHDEILSFEEMVFFAKVAVEQGISRIRLTGGEPLVRKGIVSLVETLSSIRGLEDLSLTTNGVLLSKYAKSLKRAGVRRLNISLDSVDPEIYEKITRGGRLDRVIEGIEACIAAGFNPVKLNVVMLKDVNEKIKPFINLIHKYPVHIRFIEFMPVGKDVSVENLVPAEKIKGKLRKFGKLEEVPFLDGAGPARYFRFPKAQGTFGFIPAMSQCFCEECNRLRLTADGFLRTCLFSEEELNVREAIRRGEKEDGMRRLIKQALDAKPKDYEAVQKKYIKKSKAKAKSKRDMFQIGG
ncbi:MAG: GTP 3',8-cyclase MoaA [Terriglobia bacterium]